MAASNCSDDLPLAPQPEFFTAHSGAELAGVVAQTIRVHVKPDAVMISGSGKKYGLFTRETLKAWAAEWHAGGAK